MHPEVVKTIFGIEVYKASRHTADILNNMNKGKTIPPGKISGLRNELYGLVQISERLGTPVTPAELYVAALQLSDMHRKYPELEKKLYGDLYRGS